MYHVWSDPIWTMFTLAVRRRFHMPDGPVSRREKPFCCAKSLRRSGDDHGWPGALTKMAQALQFPVLFQSKHVTTIELFWRGGGCSNLFHSYLFLWWWCPVHPSPVLFSGNLTYLPGNGHLVCNIQFGFFFCTSFPRRILAWSCALPRSHFHPPKAWKS